MARRCGTYARYVKDGCRCADCRESMRSYQARRTAEQRRQQGTPTRDPYTVATIIEGDTAWHADAACKTTPVGVFFRGRDTNLARQVCAGCQVTEPCASYARATDQQYGVWGGLTVDELHQPQRARRTA